MEPDPYNPYDHKAHYGTCAGQCTDYPSHGDEHHCGMQHHCWCPDGGLDYAEFQERHPDMAEVNA